jgi:hypothetical protein
VTAVFKRMYNFKVVTFGRGPFTNDSNPFKKKKSVLGNKMLIAVPFQ